MLAYASVEKGDHASTLLLRAALWLRCLPGASRGALLALGSLLRLGGLLPKRFRRHGDWQEKRERSRAPRRWRENVADASTSLVACGFGQKEPRVQENNVPMYSRHRLLTSVPGDWDSQPQPFDEDKSRVRP